MAGFRGPCPPTGIGGAQSLEPGITRVPGPSLSGPPAARTAHQRHGLHGGETPGKSSRHGRLRGPRGLWRVASRTVSPSSGPTGKTHVRGARARKRQRPRAANSRLPPSQVPGRPKGPGKCRPPLGHWDARAPVEGARPPKYLRLTFKLETSAPLSSGCLMGSWAQRSSGPGCLIPRGPHWPDRPIPGRQPRILPSALRGRRRHLLPDPVPGQERPVKQENLGKRGKSLDLIKSS